MDGYWLPPIMFTEEEANAFYCRANYSVKQRQFIN